jgi:hypothetical protein
LGLSYRSIRAAGPALLVAAAMGAGGMTGMASALAADPTMVGVTGTLVDGAGQPLGGVHLTIVEELPPDGGSAAFQLTSGADGTFEAELYAWGTADAPASVTIRTAPDEQLTVPVRNCSSTWAVTLDDHHDWALADASPGPLTLTAATTLLGEVCGTTGTPGGGSSNGNGGGARPTPPETDGAPRAIGAGDVRNGPALTIGFILGLVIAAALLVPMRGSRRRS